MIEIELFENIKEAYETSTPNDNRFKKFLESYKWDEKFYDDEFYFVKGDMKFFTPSLNPFDMKYCAMAVFSDGSCLAI